MKDQNDFLQLLVQVSNLPVGQFYAGDNSTPIPKSENVEIYQRAVFDIPVSGRKRLRFARNGKIREAVLAPGDILFSAPGVWKCTEWDLPHELFCLVISKDFLRVTYVDGRNTGPERKRPVCRDYFHTNLPPDPLIRDLVQNLIRLNHGAQNDPAAMFLTRSIILLAKDFLEQEKTGPGSGKAERTWQVLMQYLAENFNGTVSRADAAKHFQLNPCYISRLFRERCGKTFSAVLRDVRMEHAAYLLSLETMLIDEIAVQCGYASTQTFTTVFRQYFGLPPGQYRLLHCRD